MDNFGSSEEGNLDHLGACGGVPNMHGAGDDEIASDAHEAVLFTDRDAFLREIHTDFLENINPIENGLVDVLRGVDALTSGDEQAIDGKETRRDKARMFWNMLHMIPEKDFESSFVPKLKMEYPHLMSRREFRLEDAGSCSVKCLRHVMMKRIDLKRIVDILPSAQCCSQEEYNQLVAVQHSGEKEWADIFDLLTRNVSNLQLCQEVEKLLLKKKIGNTEPYVKVAAHGFACTCSSSAQRPLAKNSHTHTRPERLLSALKPLDGGSSSGTYPSSLMSPKDQHFEDRTDSGVMSLADVLIPSAQLSDLEQFSSTADKKRYREVEEQINTTITVASSIRMEFRHLEKIRDAARSLAKQAQDEKQLSETRQEMQKLLTRAWKRHSLIEQLYQKVHKTWKNVKDLENCLDFDVPTDWKTLLRKRHHILQNEVQECQHFAERAKNAKEEITQFCQQMPMKEESRE